MSIRDRKPAPKVAQSNSDRGEGKGKRAGSHAEAAQAKRSRQSRPECPRDGEKVEYRGCTVRLRGRKLCLRVPRLLTKDKAREWTVDRVIHDDKARAFELALDKLDEVLRS